MEQIVINNQKMLEKFKSSILIVTLNYMVQITKLKNRTVRFNLKSKAHPYAVSSESPIQRLKKWKTDEPSDY